ncbi:hypothetical protein RB195_003994 [Necator americanus]|uniref:Reverse transcriptase domain-containing protein n=1 Tax=Necator americanus TaxID=51031 RepID=A0ABR1DR70_NECAM
MDNEIWEEWGIRVDGKLLSNLRFADDIVLFSSSTNEAETMLNELNKAGKRIELRINRKKNLGRPMNMEKYLKEELNRRKRAAWAAVATVREATDQLTDQDLCARLFDSTVLPALLRSGD